MGNSNKKNFKRKSGTVNIIEFDIVTTQSSTVSNIENQIAAITTEIERLQLLKDDLISDLNEMKILEPSNKEAVIWTIEKIELENKKKDILDELDGDNWLLSKEDAKNVYDEAIVIIAEKAR